MKTIFEKSISGRSSFFFKDNDFSSIKAPSIAQSLSRKKNPLLPEMAELDIIRHYTKLSTLNKGIDNQFYPLGSCTMKYNPRFNEKMASLDAFLHTHPLSPDATVQGNLELMSKLEESLSHLTGMDAFTLQPAAGAQGEFAGLMIIKAYHKANNQSHRYKILIPDSAHGTNPASALLCGYETVTIPSNHSGEVDLDHLQKSLDNSCAGLMLTNPNTLGLFDRNILKISKLVHDQGGLLYYDGANFNAIVGQCRPSDMGFDVVHLNLHKTFSTPHGGGGPGSGPVGVKNFLKKFLPNNRIIAEKSANKTIYRWNTKKNSLSIGSLMTFHGHFLIHLRAFVYIKLLGLNGLKEVSSTAVLNANYLMHFLKDSFALPYERLCMHEFVLSAKWQKQSGISAKNISKRLIDKGYHPPTTYFPLIVQEALMIEPTETENKETLDQFIHSLKEIAQECLTNPKLVSKAPLTTTLTCIDEVRAARYPKLTCTPNSD